MGQDDLDIRLDQRSAVPLYEQICQQIRQKIENRQLQPGAALPTNHQLRQRLQVNYKTAQQAMATLAREGYVTRQARRGTVVRGIPKRGVVGIYVNLNLMSRDGANEYYRSITGHLGQLLDQHARVHRMYLGGLMPGRNTACDDLLLHITGGTLCGVLLVNMPIENDEQIIENGRRMRIPVLTLSGGSKADYSVRIDHVGFLRRAAEFLQKQGRRRIGLVYNRWSMTFHEEGIDAHALQRMIGAEKQSWVVGFTANEDGGYQAAGKLPLAELDGLIVEDDVMAVGVDRRLRESKVKVPDDLRVATIWNHGSHLKLALPVERFENEPALQARLSLELMQNVINGQRVAEPHMKLTPIQRTPERPGILNERRSG